MLLNVVRIALKMKCPLKNNIYEKNTFNQHNTYGDSLKRDFFSRFKVKRPRVTKMF